MSDQRARAIAPIGKIIKDQGRTKAWVARQAGISPSMLIHLLADRRTVNVLVAEKIAKAIDREFFLLFELTSESESVSIESEAIAA